MKPNDLNTYRMRLLSLAKNVLNGLEEVINAEMDIMKQYIDNPEIFEEFSGLRQKRAELEMASMRFFMNELEK